MLRRLHFSVMAALVFASAGTAAPASADVSFSRDVAPIVFAHCTSCHRPEGDAPFNLTTFAEVRQRAAQIVSVTRTRYMPPWKPVPGYGDFVASRRLTDAQIDLLAQWVEAGAPEGDRATLPPVPQWTPGWQLGEPDLVIRLPEHTLRSDGPDAFRNFVVRVPGSGPRYVRGMQFRPGGRGVHHANIRIDRTTASRQLDDRDPAAGYEGLILHSATYPDGHFLGWTPGQVPPLAPPELAWRLDGGSDLVVQLHMQPTGKPEPIAPVIGFYFGAGPPAKTPVIVRLGRQDLEIPPGAQDYKVTDTFVLPVDAEVHAVQPHAHFRARRLDAWATLPDGTRRPLIRIDDWDFKWQDLYRVASPFWLPAGTTLSMEYVFDNSERNPRNPDRPPTRVEWGWRSSDEMADVWLQVMARTPADRTTLVRQATVKMLTEDAVGGETLARREPAHVNLRNDTALIYMELNQPAQALRHFQVVTRVEPQSAAAHYNEGVALEALGHAAEASARYRRALQLDPHYSAAHNNLGSLLVKQGEIAEARREYAGAVAANPTNADARANLALLLLDTGDVDEALRHISEAVRLDPSRLPRLVPFVWLLTASPDAAARRPEAARRLAEQVVAATGRRDASALDVLAACYAAVGRFDAAIATATDALTVAAASGPTELRASIAAHLDRFQQGQAVVMTP